MDMTTYLLAAAILSAMLAYILATLVAGLLARSGFPLPQPERRIGCVDGLRGYLALSVLIHHFIIWLGAARASGAWEPPKINFFNQLGAGGVALFFMTTGLVFYPRILAGFSRSSWPAVYVTRAFRIVPMVVLSVAIITVIIAMRTGNVPDNQYPIAALRWVATWFSATNEPPLLNYPDSGRLNAYVLWSLSYEWLFYLLVLPACALAADAMRRSFSSWILPVMLLAVALIARALHLASAIPFLLYLPMFAIGMIAYECQRREWIARRLRAPVATILAVSALGIGMTIAPTPYSVALPLFAVFFVCVACGNQMGGILISRGALVLGECSYGIYLLHGIVLNVIFVDVDSLISSLSIPGLCLLLPMAAVIVALITPVVYLVVERPMIRIGSRLAKLWTGYRMRADAPEVEVAP